MKIDQYGPCYLCWDTCRATELFIMSAQAVLEKMAPHEGYFKKPEVSVCKDCLRVLDLHEEGKRRAQLH